MSSSSKKGAYLDNAASTPVDRRVVLEMDKTFGFYGNPSSFNNAGRRARNKLEESRSAVAHFIGARSDEIVFTSSGSEANNLALLGAASLISGKGEIITTPIEHPSILEPLSVLMRRGWKITYLPVDKYGFVDPAGVFEKLNPSVAVVSVIYANNEIGTIQNIMRIGKEIRKFNERYNQKKILFHSDACQAAGYLDMNVNNLGVDFLTFNGTKIYGPRGAGVLYVRKNSRLGPLIVGGDQEKGLRAGTENLPAIAGLARAVSLVNRGEATSTAKLRDYFIEKILSEIDGAILNGPEGKSRLSNNINVSFSGIDSESLLLELDKRGVYASSGSACTARSVEPSHVLRAIGVSDRYLKGALRLSLGRQTTKKDVDYSVKAITEAVKELRKRYKK